MNRLRRPHTITIDELTADPVRVTLASCTTKCLIAEWDMAIGSRRFVVYHNISGTVAYDGRYLAAAIRAYNEMRE